jgi:hypothetical protein
MGTVVLYVTPELMGYSYLALGLGCEVTLACGDSGFPGFWS